MKFTLLIFTEDGRYHVVMHKRIEVRLTGESDYCPFIIDVCIDIPSENYALMRLCIAYCSL